MGTKLKSSTAGMTHGERSVFFRNVIVHMTNNSNFPEPWLAGLSIAICLALADKYDSWIFAAGRGDRDNIATRNEVAIEVQNVLDKLAHYVEVIAGDNLAALRSSGFPLRQRHGKTSSSQIGNAFASSAAAPTQEPMAENLAEATKILLHAPWSPEVISREVQTTTGNPADDAAWCETAVFPPNARMEMECTAGTNTFVRYRDITENGVGNWSKPVSTFVT
ncbi:hypothetical protein [Geomesophilobacter sediminis]|uniref:Uncharacterized protein n=1 Tax=Geomesophilobacter sediminis TaxID=2798584 RepID=A0A8J7JN06_9BACT|nr:hypothetical protein [Geomesophilobacter sediminis]MBJ6726465.1 hypothetical protein [Geomesophilobacter sediminis]